MRRDSKFTNLEVFMLGIVYRIQLMSVNYTNQPGEQYRRRAYIFYPPHSKNYRLKPLYIRDN